MRLILLLSVGLVITLLTANSFNALGTHQTLKEREVALLNIIQRGQDTPEVRKTIEKLLDNAVAVQVNYRSDTGYVLDHFLKPEPPEVLVWTRRPQESKHKIKPEAVTIWERPSREVAAKCTALNKAVLGNIKNDVINLKEFKQLIKQSVKSRTDIYDNKLWISIRYKQAGRVDFIDAGIHNPASVDDYPVFIEGILLRKQGVIFGWYIDTNSDTKKFEAIVKQRAQPLLEYERSLGGKPVEKDEKIQRLMQKPGRKS